MKMSKEQKLFNKKEKKYHHRRIHRFLSTLIKVFILLIVAVFISTGITGCTLFCLVSPSMSEAEKTSQMKLNEVDESTFTFIGSTEIYDNNDKLIDKIGSSDYVYTPFSDISKYILNGYVAVEDKDFYNHNGIDYKAITRAALKMVENNGEVTQGGSTITQQLLKLNVLNDVDNQWDRKMIEFYLAPEFEKKYPKDKILEFYCNTNYYANNCYGVGQASRYYFGKEAKDVTPEEAAVIISLSNSPSRYDPVKNPDNCIKKRNTVLSTMKEQGVITNDEYNKAIKTQLNLKIQDKQIKKEHYITSFAIYCTTLKLMEDEGFEFKYIFDSESDYKQYKETYNETYGRISNRIRKGGYKIYTTFDIKAQEQLQTLIDRELDGFEELQKDGRFAMQGAATVIDNNSGDIIAMVGGRGSKDEYNRAYQAFRQPGSSIKPVIDYATAFDTLEYFPSTLIDDGKDESDKTFPDNWDNRYVGKVSIREAVERSTNTVAYRVLQQVGVNKCLKYLGNMEFSGLDYSDLHNSSIAIGGFTHGVTTLEMARAYHTLFNNGKYVGSNCLRKVEYTLGENTKELFNKPKNPKTKQIYKADSAYMTVDIMKGVLTKRHATGTQMKLSGIEAAGKTGTTNDNKDGWFCGITPAYTIAVWSGYDYPKEIPSMGGGVYPGNIWKNMQNYLYNRGGNHSREFKTSNSIVSCYINRNGEPVEYKSGKKDIFPKTYINNLYNNDTNDDEKDDGKEKFHIDNYGNYGNNSDTLDENDYNEEIKDESTEMKENNTDDVDINNDNTPNTPNTPNNPVSASDNNSQNNSDGNNTPNSSSKPTETKPVDKPEQKIEQPKTNQGQSANDMPETVQNLIGGNTNHN